MTKVKEYPKLKPNAISREYDRRLKESLEYVLGGKVTVLKYRIIWEQIKYAH